MPVVGNGEADKRRGHWRKVVLALHVQVSHPVRQRANLRSWPGREEGALRARAGAAPGLSLNGRPQPLQERPDFPIQLVVLHTVLSFSSETVLVARAVLFSNCALLLSQPLNRIAGTNAGKTMGGKLSCGVTQGCFKS